MRKYFLIFLLLNISSNSIAQVKLPVVRKSEKLRAIIFIGLDCPVSQKYMQKIEYLKWKYQSEVDFFAVVPEKSSAKKIRDFKKEYNSTLDFVPDASLAITQQLQASVTPEIFLLATNDKVLYHGAIDNWFYELGRYRLEVSEHYFVDAVEAVKKGEPPKIEMTEAIGCFIQKKISSQHQHH